MPRSTLGVVALSACWVAHDPAVVEVTPDQCATCHDDDFDRTTAPPHGASQFPRTCVDCHRTTSWVPALDGLHPALPAFPIASGAHAGIACLGCHDLDLAPTSLDGADTNCVQCHPADALQEDSHLGLKGPAGQAYAYMPAVASFCLACHPAGIAERKHPNARFPRTSGPHARPASRPCTLCHDRDAGPDAAGQNTTCLNSSCHSLSEEDRHHDDENGYATRRGDGANRHFCLDSGCHPDGRKHD